MSNWILVPVLIVAGILVGLILSRMAHAIAASPKRPEPIQRAARPLASVGLAIGVVLGLIMALGVVAPQTLEQLPRDIVAFVPRIMMAAIILIVANVLVAFATTAVAQAMGRAPLHMQRQANMVVKGLIYVMAVVLAVSQLGVDTEVVNMAIGALFFGIAASLTLLVGLGGNAVAREVASTRALRRLVEQGDTIRIGTVFGVVQAVHPTAVEIEADGGDTVLVPASAFLRETVSIERSAAEAPTGA